MQINADKDPKINWDWDFLDHLVAFQQGQGPATTSMLRASFCSCPLMQHEPQADNTPPCYAINLQTKDFDDDVHFSSLMEMVVRAHIMAFGFYSEERLLH